MTTTAQPARVGAGWIGLLSLANLGLWMGYFGPLQVLLPNQADDLSGVDKTTALGIIHVDYATQTRTPKSSAAWLGQVARTNALPPGDGTA